MRPPRQIKPIKDENHVKIHGSQLVIGPCKIFCEEGANYSGYTFYSKNASTVVDSFKTGTGKDKYCKYKKAMYNNDQNLYVLTMSNSSNVFHLRYVFK